MSDRVEFFKAKDFTSRFHGGVPEDLAKYCNSLLAERGVRGYGVESNGNYAFDTHPERKTMPAYGLQCLIVAIEPIRKAETAEGLFEECIKELDRRDCGQEFELIGRIRAWLDRSRGPGEE